MDIMGFIMGIVWLPIALLLLILAIAGGLFYKVRYKVAGADEALVITGGKKEPRILPGGGAFVSPTRKSEFFPLGVMTVRSDDQETQTSEILSIVVKWTAQLRADIETDGALEKAVRGFGGITTPDKIADSLKQTLDGEVRAVVATMTPEQVITDKATFAKNVMDGVAPRMEELGFKLVSLNISEVSDRKEHYENLSAGAREGKRMEAAKLKAQADQKIAVDQAMAEQVAQSARLDRDLAIKEKDREVTLRQAAIQIETDTAQADAEVAGKLQRELREQELATRQGEVAVVRAKQAQNAATAEREEALTRAETRRQEQKINAEAQKDRTEIAAEAEARQSEIDAVANAKVAEIDAEAKANVAKRNAEGVAQAEEARAKGVANAKRATAEADADAINLTAGAEADKIREIGLAEAEVERAKGEAEAAAALARGKAKAEAQRLMADALAANDGANLQVTLAEIQRDTTVKIFTTVGEAMARVGEHATFIDMGGSSGGNDRDLLSSVLGNIPAMLKKLDVQSEALQGSSFKDNLAGLADSLRGKTEDE